MQHPTDKIDKYQIISVLGKGAMGIVYHAYDPVVKRDVAIKFLSSLDTEETEMISRFEREARLAGSLRHPNIVTIYDLGHWEARPYIVMEYIVGRDLETVIKEKQPLTTEQRMEIVLQVYKGLEAAHSKGIIHRDIKPANIRLQEDGTVKIMDFGIARMGASQLTRSGYIIGTLQYMSPEQISGEQLDPRTDLFSAGVIAYELFTHTNPFSGGAAVDIMYRILNVKPKPLEDLPEEYGSELNHIVLRSIEKNRDLRYQTAKEVAQELEEVLFYLKTLKFRSKAAARTPEYGEGLTQNLPSDQLPVAPRRDPEIAPTVATDIPPAKMPTFGQTVAEKAPRTGIGANYSETGQLFLREGKSSKKFYLIGIAISLLIIAGLVAIGFRSKTPVATPLVINTKPPGADVLIDGQKQGATPYTIPDARDAVVTLHLEGYQDMTLTLTKNQWPASLNENLQPIAAVQVNHLIMVQSSPAGAAILLDGKELGKAPAQVTLPDTQPHQMTLRLEGYADVTQKIDANTPDSLSIELTSNVPPGTVKYTGQYPVSLFVNGKAYRDSFELPPGTYTVSIRSKGAAFIHANREVEVKSGETSVVQQPAMGKLTVKANPSNCKISIDGEYVDSAPIFNLPVQTGSHVVTFNWDTLGKKTTKPVVISSSETQSLMGSAN